LGLVIVSFLELIILDLEISCILFQSLQLSLSHLFTLHLAFHFTLEPGVLTLQLQQTGLLLNQHSLQLFVLVLDSPGDLLQSLHLLHVVRLETVDVLLKSVFDELFLFVHDLLDC